MIMTGILDHNISNCLGLYLTAETPGLHGNYEEFDRGPYGITWIDFSEVLF